MRVVAINPNSTPSMTHAIAHSVGTVIGGCVGITNDTAPKAIQGPEDGALAVPGVLRIIRETPADAYIIACFDDTGLAEARRQTPALVLGIGQASYHVATLLRPRFAVVTTLAVSVPVIERNIDAAGFGPSCSGVFASGVPVLDLEHDPEGSFRKVSAAIAEIEARDPHCAVILGCAGMGILRERLQASHTATILDPVICAARLAATLTAADITRAA